jgi:lipoprotein-anchoring transpeptidase ErfK/SrfK
MSQSTSAAALSHIKTGTTPCQANTESQFVLVSISAQQAWMCEAMKQVNSTPVTTGDVESGYATPSGSWRVHGKQTNRYLTGPGYSDFVHFWVPFNGDYGFHDASWQSIPFGSPRFRTHGSHGCVHLPATAMTWLYSWIHSGTLVTVQR